MKNRHIWLVIGCILVVGILVTRYTNSFISHKEAEQMAAASAVTEAAREGALAAESAEAEAAFAGAGGNKAGALAGAKDGAAVPPTLAAAAAKGAGANSAATTAGEILQDSGAPDEANAFLEKTDEGEAANRDEIAMAEAAPQEAGPDALRSADAGAGKLANPETAAAGPGAAPVGPGAAPVGPGAATGGPGAAAASSGPASPLEGTHGRAEKNAALSSGTDYRQRLLDLDSQIQKLREEDKDASAYSMKATAESELKLWEGEMNTVYNALLDHMDQEEAKELAAEQQTWMKNREARAVENSAKNSAANLEGVGVTAALASLTRARTYDLVDRYEKLTEGNPDAG